MSSFAHFLRFYRQERGETQAHVAKIVSTSPQNISALERQDGAKTPSMKVLKRIVRHLAWDSEKALWNIQAARDLAFSGLDLDLPLLVSANIDQELASQAESPEGSEIWIVSDVLAEAESREFARHTVKNILKRKLRYTYFVPFSSAERFHWEKALKWLQDEAKRHEKGRERLDERVAVFQVSDCAFSARLRITNPRREPTATYGLGKRERAHMMFTPVPTDLVVKTVQRLTDLLGLVEGQEQDKPQDRQTTESLIFGPIFGGKELGHIRRVYLPHK